MEVQQSRAQFAFMTGIKLNEAGYFSWKATEGKEEYQSRLYKPKYKVSGLAKKFKALVDAGTTFELSSLIEPSETVALITRDKVRYSDNNVYTLIQSVFLEAAAMLYCVEHERSWDKLIFQEDILRIHSNVNYIIEALPVETYYHVLIKDLRDILIDIMYVSSRLGGHYGTVY